MADVFFPNEPPPASCQLFETGPTINNPYDSQETSWSDPHVENDLSIHSPIADYVNSQNTPDWDPKLGPGEQTVAQTTPASGSEPGLESNSESESAREADSQSSWCQVNDDGNCLS